MISLTAKRLPAEKLARAFVSALGRVESFLRRHDRAFIATMGRGGALRIVARR